MTTNDLYLLDSIIEKRIQELGLTPNNQVKGSVFEKIALKELLKAYDLSDEAIEEGITDGENDGGIDAIYVFANGNLCTDGSEIIKSDSISLTTYLITSKHDDTFIMHPLESMYSSINNLFDFSKKKAELTHSYNEKVVEKALLYRNILRNNLLSVKSNTFKVCYVSRGETTRISDPVKDKINEICEIITKHFTDSKALPMFWGSKELLISTRIERNGLVSIQCERHLQYKNDYVVLVKLSDYYKFVTDETGTIKKYFFDENVRDFLGSNNTNSDILETLNTQDDTIDFWNLNNGITILAKEFRLIDNEGVLKGVQIVNGLQTTMSIYNYFNLHPGQIDNRLVLIKIISEKNEEDRKRIIRATNNQSQIALYSLHANDKIQKDIEDILLADSLYYERKRMFYQNKGISKKDIITPLIIARVFVSVFLKNPCSAGKLKQEFMENTAKYNLVFNNSINIKLWPVLAKIAFKVVEYQRLTNKSRALIANNANKIYLSYLCFLSVLSVLKTFSYGINELLSFNVNAIDKDMIADQLKLIDEFVAKKGIRRKKLLQTRYGNELLDEFKKQQGITDEYVLTKNSILDDDYQITKETTRGIRSKFHEYKQSGVEINDCFELLEKEFKIDKKIVRAILFEY